MRNQKNLGLKMTGNGCLWRLQKFLEIAIKKKKRKEKENGYCQPNWLNFELFLETTTSTSPRK